MPAPKGNQYAIGNNGGRPPTYDVAEQTKALDEWSKTDDATALCQFCNQQDIYSDLVYDWRDRDEEFARTLKKAKSRIAERLRRRLDAGIANYGLVMAELGFHDKFYHDYQEGLKDKAAERAKGVEGAKKSIYSITVAHDLASGSIISSSPISDEHNKGTE